VASVVPNGEATQFKSGKKAAECGRKGGIASGEAKREKATFKKAVEWLANSDIKIKSGDIYEVFKKSDIDISNLNTTQLATIGLWYGAVQGNATNYKTLMEANNEVETEVADTPDITINIVDNSNLEKALYDEED
jgi:hypothetical protein